jgi:23S rRNA pseudouridine2605 synthase
LVSRGRRDKDRALGRDPRGDSAAGAARQQSRGAKAPGQPDPLRTSVGYIGADSLSRQRQQQARKGRTGRGAARKNGPAGGLGS